MQMEMEEINLSTIIIQTSGFPLAIPKIWQQVQHCKLEDQAIAFQK